MKHTLSWSSKLERAVVHAIQSPDCMHHFDIDMSRFKFSERSFENAKWPICIFSSLQK